MTGDAAGLEITNLKQAQHAEILAYRTAVGRRLEDGLKIRQAEQCRQREEGKPR